MFHDAAGIMAFSSRIAELHCVDKLFETVIIVEKWSSSLPPENVARLQTEVVEILLQNHVPEILGVVCCIGAALCKVSRSVMILDEIHRLAERVMSNETDEWLGIAIAVWTIRDFAAFHSNPWPLFLLLSTKITMNCPDMDMGQYIDSNAMKQAPHILRAALDRFPTHESAKNFALQLLQKRSMRLALDWDKINNLTDLELSFFQTSFSVASLILDAVLGSGRNTNNAEVAMSLDILTRLSFCKVEIQPYLNVQEIMRRTEVDAMAKHFLVQDIDSCRPTSSSLLHRQLELCHYTITIMDEVEYKVISSIVLHALATPEHMKAHAVAMRIISRGHFVSKPRLPFEWQFVEPYVHECVELFPKTISPQQLTTIIGQLVGVLPSETPLLLQVIEALSRRAQQLHDSTDAMKHLVCTVFVLVKVVGVDAVPRMCGGIERMIEELQHDRFMLLTWLYQIISSGCDMDRRTYLAEWYMRIQ